MWDEIAGLESSPRTEVPIWIGNNFGAIRMQVDGVECKLLLNHANTGWYKLSSLTGSCCYTSEPSCVSVDLGGDRRRSRRSVSRTTPSAQDTAYNASAQDGNNGGGTCTFLFKIEDDPHVDHLPLNLYHAISSIVSDRASDDIFYIMFAGTRSTT